MLKYGFHEHHTIDCDMKLKSEDAIKRVYWCNTHGQWCYEYPLTTVNTYEDGVVYSTNRRMGMKFIKGELK